LIHLDAIFMNIEAGVKKFFENYSPIDSKSMINFPASMEP